MERKEGLGWFDKIKVNVQSLSEKFDINLNKIIEIAAYFAAGFFIGFLLSRNARVFIFSLIFLVIGLFLLDNFEIIHIDWIKVREFTGISPQETVGELFKSYFEWVKTNIIIVVSAIIGFLLGYKLG